MPTCPHCIAELGPGPFSQLSCGACDGCFVPRADVARLLQAVADGKIATGHAGDASPYRASPQSRANKPVVIGLDQTVRYVSCPLCGKRMNRQQAVRGVTLVVDVCWQDGVWFDADEIRKLSAQLAPTADADRNKLAALLATLARG